MKCFFYARKSNHVRKEGSQYYRLDWSIGEGSWITRQVRGSSKRSVESFLYDQSPIQFGVKTILCLMKKRNYTSWSWSIGRHQFVCLFVMIVTTDLRVLDVRRTIRTIGFSMYPDYDPNLTKTRYWISQENDEEIDMSHSGDTLFFCCQFQEAAPPRIQTTGEAISHKRCPYGAKSMDKEKRKTRSADAVLRDDEEFPSRIKDVNGAWHVNGIWHVHHWATGGARRPRIFFLSQMVSMMHCSAICRQVISERRTDSDRWIIRVICRVQLRGTRSTGWPLVISSLALGRNVVMLRSDQESVLMESLKISSKMHGRNGHEYEMNQERVVGSSESGLDRKCKS